MRFKPMYAQPISLERTVEQPQGAGMRPHDANGLAVHVEAHQPVKLEVPLPRAVGGASLLVLSADNPPLR